MAKIEELFPDKDEQKAIEKILKQKITGQSFKIERTRYVKLGPKELSILEPTVGEDARDENDGLKEMEQANGLVTLFGAQLRMLRIEHNRKYVLHERNPKTQELSVANYEHIRARMRHLIGDELSLRRADAAVTRAMDILQCTDDYRVAEESVAPLLLANEAPERYCYKRLPITSEPLHECPAPFADFLSLVKTDQGREAVILWLGSVLDPSTSRIQYLCLYGGGQNGKSTLIDTLSETLGSAALSMSSGDFMSRFGLGDAGNKRLLLFDDNNNGSFMSSGDFKRVTGSATLGVERKGQDRYHVRNNLKILIATNRLPNLMGDKADLRRNLFVETDEYKGDASGGDAWVTAFKAAGPDILRFCFTKFQEYKTRSGKTQIPVVETGEELVQGMSGMAEAEDFIQEHYTEEPSTQEAKLLVTPGRVRDDLVNSKLAPEIKKLVKEIMHNKYRIKRLKPADPRVHQGVYLRTSALVVAEEPTPSSGSAG